MQSRDNNAALGELPSLLRCSAVCTFLGPRMNFRSLFQLCALPLFHTPAVRLACDTSMRIHIIAPHVHPWLFDSCEAAAVDGNVNKRQHWLNGGLQFNRPFSTRIETRWEWSPCDLVPYASHSRPWDTSVRERLVESNTSTHVAAFCSQLGPNRF